MNSHQKLELLTTEIEKYLADLRGYGGVGGAISTKKVEHDISNILKKVDE